MIMRVINIASMDPATKRVLTDEARDLSDAANAGHPSMPLEPDMLARLRNVGARVRKNVTEGYQTHRSLSTASPTQSLSGGNYFRSSSDTLIDVFSSQRSPAPQALNKRPLPDSDDVPIQDEEAFMDTETTPERHLDRPIKPLRKSGQTAGKVVSSPTVPLAPSSSYMSTEEDWSADGSSSFVPMLIPDD